jgi:hypothetical protein
MITPQGSLPTLTSLSLTFFAVSITDTLLERPFATYNFFPSGVIAIFPESTAAPSVRRRTRDRFAPLWPQLTRDFQATCPDPDGNEF